MSDQISESPEDDAQIIWHGRPDVGLHLPDVNAAICAFLATFAVLSTGFAYQQGWQWTLPLRLGVAYGGVVGIVTALGRAAGGGLTLILTTAFWATVSVAALYTTQDGTALLCPLTVTAVMGTVLFMRYRQRRATRYQLTCSRVLVGERGRYVIAFPLEGLPAVRPDWFGRSLGEVEFEAGDATLTTQDGKVFTVPAQARVFTRVLHPERLLEVLKIRQETGE